MRRAFRQFLLLCVLALVPALVSGAYQLKWRKPDPLAPGEVRAETVRLWGENVLWVDARPRSRFTSAHIPGAVLLNLEEWDKLIPEFLDEWEPEKAVVVYCDGGDCEASHEVAARLKQEVQIQTVYVLKGGFPAWSAK